jgi:hypothetical protein
MPGVIHNCQWILECPLTWDNLQATEDINVRNCDSCKQQVYMCHTEIELKIRIEKKQCVAIRPNPLVPATLGVPSPLTTLLRSART